MLHWHVSIVGLNTIPNYIGILPMLWSTILPPIPKNILPIHPDDPAFSQQFAGGPGDGTVPSTSGWTSNLPNATAIIHK